MLKLPNLDIKNESLNNIHVKNEKKWDNIFIVLINGKKHFFKGWFKIVYTQAKNSQSLLFQHFYVLSHMTLKNSKELLIDTLSNSTI